MKILLRNVFFLSAGILLLYLAFKGQDMEKIGSALLNVDWKWIIFAKILSIFAHISRAMRWKLLIEPLRYQPSLKNVLAAVFTGYFVNFAIPRLGEVFRCRALKDTDGLPVTALIGTVVTERVADMLTALIILGIALFVKYSLLMSFLEKDIIIPLKDRIFLYSEKWEVIATSVFMIIIVGILIYFFRKSKILIKVKFLMNNIWLGIITVRKLKKTKMFVVHTVFIWLMYYIGFYLSFFALPETAILSPDDGLFVFSLTNIAMAAPVQGGIGAFHWMAMKGFVLTGLSESTGLTMGTIIHGASVLLLSLGGSISLLYVLWVKLRKSPANLKK